MTSQLMGTYSSRIDNTLDFIQNLTTLQCHKCDGLLTNPRLTSAKGKLVCLDCTPSLTCCPVTGGPLDLRECPEEVLAILSTIKIFCLYKSNGCPESINVNRLAEHEQECGFRETTCPHKPCDMKTIAAELNMHLQVCAYAPKSCLHCGKSVLNKELQAHQESCREKLKECPGCKLQIKVTDYDQHTASCDKIQTICPKCHKSLSKEERLRHEEVSCLEGMIEDFNKKSTEELLMLKNSINYLSQKLTEKESLLFIKCSSCEQRACEVLTRFCDHCNHSFCLKCFKHALPCNECSHLRCLFCLPKPHARADMCNIAYAQLQVGRRPAIQTSSVMH